MEAFGAATKDIDSAIAILEARRQHDDEFILYADNWDAWEVFRRVNTQWDKNHFTGSILGLNYSAVTNVINMMIKRKKRIEIFDAVRLIERGFLDNQPAK
jgi:hypothetical protein